MVLFCPVSNPSTSIVDTTQPVITPPNDITFEATNLLTPLTTSNYGTATDIFGTIITNNAASSFAIGDHAITWSATDSNGNTSNDTQTITIQDITPPDITAPQDQSFEATNLLTPLTTSDYGTATATDIFDFTINTSAPQSFPLDNTTITWSVIDVSNNTNTATQTITVLDTTPPVITIPPNITVEATGEYSQVNLGIANATDHSGINTITNNATESFRVGVYTILYNATDNSGNHITASQIITIADTTPPVITPPNDITFEATSLSTALTQSDYGVATASDIFATTITGNSTGIFPLGQTVIMWSATDYSNNTSATLQNVTLQDTTPPVIEILGESLLIEEYGVPYEDAGATSADTR